MINVIHKIVKPLIGGQKKVTSTELKFKSRKPTIAEK